MSKFENSAQKKDQEYRDPKKLGALGRAGLLALATMPLSVVAMDRGTHITSEATDETPAPNNDGSSVEISVESHTTPASEVVGEVSAQSGERQSFDLPYERDFDAGAEVSDLTRDYMRNYVAEHMDLFADPGVHIDELVITGTASPEHGDGPLAGMDTHSDSLDRLSKQRSDIAYSTFVEALNEAMPGNPERVAEILSVLQVESAVRTPTAEQLVQVQSIAEKHNMSVNDLVDAFNREQGFADSLDTADLEFMKELMKRGAEIQLTRSTTAQAVGESESVTTIGSIKPTEEESTPPALVDVTNQAVRYAQNLIFPRENAVQRDEKTEATVPPITNPPFTFKIDKKSRDRQASSARGAWSPSKRQIIKQPGRGNVHNSRPLSQKQRGKGRPGSSHNMGRKGR